MGRWIAGLGLWAGLGGVATAGAEPLCPADARVFFACGVKGGKRVAICGDADPAAAGARVVYRFGKPGAVELERVLRGAGAPGPAFFAEDTHAASISLAVGFDVGDVRTTVYDQETLGTASQNGAGVLVELGRGSAAARTVSIPCLPGPRTLDLQPLQPVLAARP